MKSHEPVYFFNGRYVPRSEVRLPVNDLGVMRGFALFESLRTYEGRPFLLHEHVRRLRRAGARVGLKCPYSESQIAGIVDRLFRKNRFSDLLVRILITGGESRRMFPERKPVVVIMADPFHPFPAWQYEKGLDLMSIPFSRIEPDLKSTCYFSAVHGTARAVKHGFAEAVYALPNGDLLEGTTFNLFALMPGGRLVTPRENVLAGVTADCVLKIVRRQGLKVERRPMSRRMLRQAAEMFITSSNREIIPVVRVDHQRVGGKAPGPVTRQIHTAYRRLIFSRTRHRTAPSG